MTKALHFDVHLDPLPVAILTYVTTRHPHADIALIIELEHDRRQAHIVDEEKVEAKAGYERIWSNVDWMEGVDTEESGCQREDARI